MLSSATRPQFETNVNTENLWYTTKTNSSSSPGQDLWGLYVRQVKSPPDYTLAWFYMQSCVLIRSTTCQITQMKIMNTDCPVNYRCETNRACIFLLILGKWMQNHAELEPYYHCLLILVLHETELVKNYRKDLS